jgi:hypothetical protein
MIGGKMSGDKLIISRRHSPKRSAIYGGLLSSDPDLAEHRWRWRSWTDMSTFRPSRREFG